MGSMFNTLNIGYSGLAAAQVGIDVTGHNITNAESAGYTRQRVVQSAQTPISGTVGNGVEITDTKRVFDNFVFDNYVQVSADKEYADFSQRTLEELSTYFPEIDGVGIKADLAEYYNMWQTFADNPDNDAIKTALAQQTTTLTEHINQTQDQVKGLQDQLNNQLESDVNQVNELASQLADLNRSIDAAEAGGGDTANDLRDRRNVIERDLARLIGSEVSQGELDSNIQIDSNSNIRTGSYTLNVNGFNIVDGGTYHPLHLGNEQNASGFYEVSYERQDGTLIPLEESINSGKIGAIFDLRGGAIDTTTGQPTDGIVQNTMAQLDAFAKGLAESTNNLYAESASSKKDSNSLELSGDTALASSNLNINQGSFDIVIYDNDGEEVSRRAIEIDAATSMTGTNSIESKINDNTLDDNNDGNADNDIDDFILFNYSQAADGTLRVEMQMTPESDSLGYTFSIEDNLTDSGFASGTNFAGAIGLGRYLDGDSASNIKLTTEYENNPTKLVAGSSGASGDSSVALNMVQQQFESYDFEVGQETYNSTIYGMFDVTSTYVGISTNTAISQNDTITAQYNATELEYFSTSKVSVDEEMTNLIKYQTSYGAAAKIITTIDQMMQTLLGIKR